LAQKTELYQEIAEAIRREILLGPLKPGDPLPTVREASQKWGCASGTALHAYQELARQGLIVSRPGQGTYVATSQASQASSPPSKSSLIHQVENLLLNCLADGYRPEEVERAMQLVLDRCRVRAQAARHPSETHLEFVGSHDPAVSLIATRFVEAEPEYSLRITYSGSLGGLIALSRHEADIAGSHLWDEDTDRYNQPFVQRLLPGRRVALVTLTYRHLGLLTARKNPLEVKGIEDLLRPELRFINRQEGAGTRVWLDAQLRRRGIDPQQIRGYNQFTYTHTELANKIAEGQADIGLAVEAAAIAYDLDFIQLAIECYHLVIPSETWDSAPVQALVRLINRQESKDAIAALGGYDTRPTGEVEWV
jgi:molybdate-binding protein/DNA-binding transcriptional regulator YhcF (GntR family)